MDKKTYFDIYFKLLPDVSNKKRDYFTWIRTEQESIRLTGKRKYLTYSTFRKEKSLYFANGLNL